MAERVLMKGNEDIAEAAIRAGCRHYFGYPITPQTEVAAYMAKKLPKVGGVFLQAESEVASINMVYGAAATGTRVMTSSSTPGISLMAEGLSYIVQPDDLEPTHVGQRVQPVQIVADGFLLSQDFPESVKNHDAFSETTGRHIIALTHMGLCCFSADCL